MTRCLLLAALATGPSLAALAAPAGGQLPARPAATQTERTATQPPAVPRPAILILAMVLAGLGALAVPLAGPDEDEEPEARALRW